MYHYRLKNIRVVDGDTVDGDVLLGFGITIRKRIRLSGINAPETRTRDKEEKKRGKAAKKWLKDRLKGDVSVVTEKDATGKYGRVLGRLYTGSALESVNQRMIEACHAVEY